MKAAQAFGTLQVPAHWQTVDVISDLHLQATELATFEASRKPRSNAPCTSCRATGIFWWDPHF